MTYPTSPPDPPEARHWVTISADFLCAMVAFGDRPFAKADSANQLTKSRQK